MRRLLLSFLTCILTAQATPEPARIQTFQTNAKAVRRGATVTLRWNATGADQVRLDPLGLILPAKGEVTHLVTGRMVYWLHVFNAAGGQSTPLVVELLPEEAVPGLAVPAVPVPPMSVASPGVPMTAPPERPRLAELPRIPAPAPALLRVALPMTRRLAGHTRPVYIQFATTVSTRGAARLQRTLLRVATTDAQVTVRHRRSGRPFLVLRSGPFPSVQAANLRLQALAPTLKRLNLKPILVLGAPQSLVPGTTYLAEARQPG